MIYFLCYTSQTYVWLRRENLIQTENSTVKLNAHVFSVKTKLVGRKGFSYLVFGFQNNLFIAIFVNKEQHEIIRKLVDSPSDQRELKNLWIKCIV